MHSHLCQARGLSDIDYLPQREICGQLRRARFKKLLTVCLQIHLEFCLICSLASSRTAFALSHGQRGTGSQPLFLPIPESVRANDCESRHSRSYIEHYSCRLVAKSLRSQARGEEKESPPSQSTDHIIVCSQGKCGPELHHDPQNCSNGEQQKHESPADDDGHIQPISMVASIGFRRSLS